MGMKDCLGMGFAAILALAACVPGDPAAQVPPGAAFVRLGNGGSLFGSAVTTVYQGDVAIFRASTPGQPERASLVTLRAGAFDRLRTGALSLLARTEGMPADEPLCLDYGIDLIEVSDGAEIEALVSSGCPNDGVTAAQSELRTMINAEIVE